VLIRKPRRRIKKLLALAADPTVDLWALDEVHFQQHGSRCKMWIAPEQRDPVVRHAPTRKSIGYFGAVRLRDGKLVTMREDEVFDSESFWRFLKLLKRVSRASGKRVVVITDNAKYHHGKLHKAWREQHSASFALDYLPPYSPQLNPIERVWKLLRRLRLHNQYFGHLSEVTTAVEAQFTLWHRPNQILRRLCGHFG
jgi:transposase